jgi:transcriptional regulator with XRE-family HTH domain
VESIKHVRKALGLSLADVADRVGLHREQVARAERDGVDVKASTLLLLARAMGVPVCTLFGKEGKHGESNRRRRRKASKRQP